MLPLKVFNTLPSITRKRIAKVVFSYMGDDFIEQMATPFYHNFDYDGGHWYKLMLDHCSYNKEKNKIKVTVTFNV